MLNSAKKKDMILGGLIFFIISFVSMHIAMIFYPGGTFIDSGTVGYMWWNNFFSDLGATITQSGDTNQIAFILFTFSVIASGISFFTVFLVLPTLYSDSKKSKWTSILGTVFGLLTGFLLIAITFFPEDLNFTLHQQVAAFMYLGMMFTFALYAIATLWNKNYSIKYVLIYLAIAIELFIFIYIVLFLQPDPYTPDGLLLYVLGQKLIHYTLWIGFSLALYGIWKKIE